MDAAIEHYGKLDILFNNVGSYGAGMVTEIDEETLASRDGCGA